MFTVFSAVAGVYKIKNAKALCGPELFIEF